MRSSDRTGVIAPPLAIFPAFLALAWLLARWRPLLLPGEGLMRYLAAVCFLAAVVLSIWALVTFRRLGTTVNPLGGTARIAEGGPFRYTRNPMYVALALVHLAIGLALAEGWYLIALVPALLVMHYGVVLREERYLEGKFGADYRAYRARVRRWL